MIKSSNIEFLIIFFPLVLFFIWLINKHEPELVLVIILITGIISRNMVELRCLKNKIRCQNSDVIDKK
jgi:hypothetical protein